MKKITRFYKKISFNLKPKLNVDKIFNNFNSLDEIFNYFGTDKGTNVKNQYDKNSDLIIGHGFAKFYEKHLSIFKNQKFNLLEIGTWRGASSAAFTVYFNEANIFGVDRDFRFNYKSNRIKFINCDLTNEKEFKDLNKIIDNKTFKIIIDDGSHILTHIIKNLKIFLKKVESNCYYIIEDFNAPKDLFHLNDGNGEEVFIDEMLLKIKKKEYFESKILNEKDQDYLFENIDKIYTYEGNLKKPLSSNIAFLKKK
tara:strand:- start:8 stop:769 length:762 start_codon:yes stop_codon:yes gene_type:complete